MFNVAIATVAAVTSAGASVRAPLYGSINEYAYYFVDILVGTPPSRQSVILDSGSSLLAFPCSGCGQRCGRHLDLPFNISASASASLYSCEDPRCMSQERCLRNDASCLYTQIYSEGSSIQGYFFSDRVALDPGAGGGDPFFVNYNYIGCHTKETVLFTTQQASGILGVSFPKGGRQPTVMDECMRDARVDRKVFALCASEEGGVLTIGTDSRELHKPSISNPSPNAPPSGGRFFWWTRKALPFLSAPPRPSDDIVWTSLTTDTSYSIALARIYLLKKTSPGLRGGGGLGLLVDGDFGETLVDSGTTYTYFPGEIYKKIADELLKLCAENNRLSFDAGRIGTCVKSKADLICYNFGPSIRDDISSPSIDEQVQELIAKLPSFLLQFADGGVVEWAAENWLFKKTSRIWCSAVENNRRTQTILGMSFMKQKDVIFDRAERRVGMVAARCPVHTVVERGTAR